MDQNYIEKNNIDTKYLRNQLTPEQTEEFEVYLLDHPEMLEQIELDTVLGVELPNLESNSRQNMLANWFRIKSFSTGAVVASVCAVIFQPLLFQFAENANSPSAFLSQTRGVSGDDAAVTFVLDDSNFKFWNFGASQKFVALLDHQAGDGEKFKLVVYKRSSLKSETYSEYRDIGYVETRLFQPVAVVLSAKNFPPGAYKIKMAKTSDSNNTEVTDYNFTTALQY